jgi:hypothetical protein
MTGRFQKEIAVIIAAVACAFLGLSVAEAKPKIITVKPPPPVEPKSSSPEPQAPPPTACGPYPDWLEGEFAQVRIYENKGLKETYTTTGVLQWRKAKDLNEPRPSGFMDERSLSADLWKQADKAYNSFPKNECLSSVVNYNLIGGQLKVSAEYHSYNEQFGGGCDAKGEKSFEVANLKRFYDLWIAGSDTLLFLAIPDYELAMEVNGSCKFPHIRKQPFNSAANDNAVEIIGRPGKLKEGVHGQISPPISVAEHTKLSASWDFSDKASSPSPDAGNPKP